MATLGDIGVSALINILTAFVFLLAFAMLRIQPVNDRVYFPKWYISGGRNSPRSSTRNFVGKYVNLNICTYFTFLNWMPQALKMSETEIISHAGFDSAVFLRIYTLGFVVRLFVPPPFFVLFLLFLCNLSDSCEFLKIIVVCAGLSLLFLLILILRCFLVGGSLLFGSLSCLCSLIDCLWFWLCFLVILFCVFED